MAESGFEVTSSQLGWSLGVEIQRYIAGCMEATFRVAEMASAVSRLARGRCSLSVL
jgi:hypothetical protein